MKLAFGFPEPATVQFDGIRLRFARTLNQTFQMGLISPGTLQTWLAGGKKSTGMFEGR